MGQHLSLVSVEQLATAVAAMAVTGDADFDAERTLALVILARTARDAGADIDKSPFLVDSDAVITAGASRAPAGIEAVVEWLWLDPPFDAVKTAPTRLGAQAPQGVINAFGDWAGKASEQNRTEFILALLENPGPTTSAWISAVVAHPYDEERAVDAVAAKVHAASRSDDRLTYVRLLVAASFDARRDFSGRTGRVRRGRAINPCAPLAWDHRTGA
jgi:hypothetical protein